MEALVLVIIVFAVAALPWRKIIQFGLVDDEPAEPRAPAALDRSKLGPQ